MTERKFFMNNDLINRDALESEFIRIGLIVTNNDSAAMAAYIVNKFPAANYETVVHGRWIPESNHYDDDTWICSACKEVWSFGEWHPKDIGMNYCPNCGARMDGGAT